MANRFLDQAPEAGGGSEGGGNRFLGTKTTTGKKKSSLGDKAKKVGGGALKLITAPLGALQQATFRTGSALGEAISGEGGEAVKELGRGVKELATVGFGQEDTNFQEAMVPVKHREAYRRGEVTSPLENLVGDRAADIIGLGGDIVLDPLFPTVFSKAKNIKQAAKVTESVVGKEGLEAITKQGVKNMSKAEKAKLEAGIATKAVETGATGGRRTLTEIAQGVKAPAKMTTEEGAERLVSKTLKGLQQAENARPATAVGRGAEALSGAGGAQVKRATDAIRRTSFGEWLDDALRPRAGIERNWGKELADTFKAEGDTRLARFAKRSGDTLTELNARMSQAVKAGGKVTAEENKLLGAALRGEQWAIDTVKGTRLADVFAYAADLEKKTSVASAAVKAPAAAKGGKAAAVAVTPVAGESPAMAKLREILARQGTTPETVKAANAGQPVQAATIPKAAASRAGVKQTVQVGDDNPLKDVLNRHFEMIHAEETGSSLGRMKATITDPDTGEALVRQVGREDELPENWVRLKSTHWSGHAAPKEIAGEIDRVGRIIDDGTALGKMGKFVDRYDAMWKTSATSLPVNLAFTLRNARSNLFLNWLDGLYTMGPYKEAFRIQNKVRAIAKGEKFGADIQAKGVDAVLKASLSPREYKIFRAAQDHRVLGSNYFQIDASVRGTGKVRSVKGVEQELSAVGRVKAAGGEAADRGRSFNSRVEDNARLANFIHNLDRTGDAKIAASHVHKFLFDYADLTDVETSVKKLIPFYTFMRKNTPLQVASALKMPGKVGTRMKIGEAVTEPVDEDSPSYLQRSGAVNVPGLEGLLGAVGDVAFTPETPMTAAAQTISPFAKLGELAPAILTGDGEKLKEMPAEVWRPLVSLMGGARGAPLKVVFGEAGQRDLFSGAELPPEDVRLRAAQAMLPVIGRFLSTAPNEVKASILEGISEKQVKEEDKEALRTWLLRQAGFKVREVK